MITTRRDFIKLVSASSGVLILGLRLDATTDEAASLEPNAWVSIHPDGSVLIRIGKSEMGQGVRTSLPMILTEELDADLSSVKIEQASPSEVFNRLGTGGSGSIMRMWDPLREAGATARAMLVAAAAARWNVDPSTCTTSAGVVSHSATRRKAKYGDLAAAASTLPVPQNVPLKKREDFRLIGKDLHRTDGPDIVTGRAVYGLDVRVPGMVFAVLARPPRFGATMAKLDSRKAESMPGVVKVVEIPQGVAVVGSTTWAALEGRRALRIEWENGEGSDFDSDEHAEKLRAATEQRNLVIHTVGNGAADLELADRKIEAVYEYGFEAHAPVEPVNCTVLAEEDRCTIWSPTQTPNSVQAVGAHVLGIDRSAVQVNVIMMGGGFGRRLGHDFDREAVEIASRMKGTPVQLVWSREDDMKHGYFQAASAHRLAAGIDESGRVTSWLHRKTSSPHNARSVSTEEQRANPDVVRGWAWGVYDNPYAIPSMEMSYGIVDSPVLIGPWRSVFSPPSVFARECFIDEIATELDRDPIDLRLELLGRDDESIPHTLTFDDDKSDRRRLRGVLDAVAKLSRWNAPVKKGHARGIACNVFHTETYIAYVVDVSLRPDAPDGALPFRVHSVAAAVDCGVVVNPNGVRQQVESGIIWSLSNMKSEITFREGAAEQSYFSDFPVVMIDETPAVIDVSIIESDDDRPHGLGEPTVCPFAPAVASALSRLAGRRIRKLPVKAADLA